MPMHRNGQPVKSFRALLGKGATLVVEWAARDPKARQRIQLELLPLTPRYKPDQHHSYVSHLNVALKDDEIRNIALTGRYGAGKSSILKEFARQNQERVLFLSLSTLGPEDPDETKTNQIEKELVKQLLHREKPARLPQSRYQRIERLGVWRALVGSAALLGLITLALWLFGAVPDLAGLRGDTPTWIRVGASALAIASSVWFLAAARVAIHNRLVVSEVSAIGASITLANKSETYFDKYLDEIVYFFESRSQVDVVVFEDLDRFNHAGIFEALRELNTILNNSKQITGSPLRKTRRRSIRFVYALRDSIFEQLGHDTKELKNDAAQAEAVRANRTKFFDLIIPLLPFITHRTARDLLGKIQTERQHIAVPKASDELADLVARHLPDMRILTNVWNEYSIFTRRLITERHGMDKLKADHIFSLVAYKNLHPEDFELMLLGRSNLDAIYQFSRELVARNISDRRGRLRKLSDGLALQDAVREQSSTWGENLNWFLGKVVRGAGPNGSLKTYSIAGTEHNIDESTTPDFWKQMIENNGGVSAKIFNPSYGRNEIASFDMDELQRIIGSGFKIADLASVKSDELLREKSKIEGELALLRSADFVDLAKRPDFRVRIGDVDVNFRRFVADKIGSELGQALVTDGYIDRYYNMYSAQYYGERVPTNAMSYIVQHIDANKPDIEYPFNSASEIDALLKETNRSFLSDASAYNVGILDHLLATNDPGAEIILDNVIRYLGEIEFEFFDIYLTVGEYADKAVAYYAGRWPAIFTEIIERTSLEQKRRVQLVDVALANSSIDVPYQIDDVVRQFLQENHKKFHTIASPREANESLAASPAEDEQPDEQSIANAVGTLKRADFQCDDLAAVRESAMRAMIRSDCYVLSARNLRAALGEPGPLNLDRIRDLNAEIYEDVIAHPDEYLAGIETERESSDMNTTADQHLTRWTIEDPAAFVSIVSDLAELSKEQIVSILQDANPSCGVDDLATVPTVTWEALAECHRFPATLGNLEAYIGLLGEIDAHLADILTTAASIELPELENEGEQEASTAVDTSQSTEEFSAEEDEVEAVKVRIAQAVLGASIAISDPRMRAKLVGSLNLMYWLPIERVPREQGRLLGDLVAERICRDDAPTFAHFDTSHWPTMLHGIRNSANFAMFVTPELVGPSSVARLLESSDITDDMKRTILRRFDEFVPADSKVALVAVGRAALATGVNPGAAKLAMLAQGAGDGDLVVRLAHRFRNDLTTEEMLDVLLSIGGSYGRLTMTGEKLTFPRNGHHEGVFQRLKASRRVRSRAYSKSLLKLARIEIEVL